MVLFRGACHLLQAFPSPEHCHRNIPCQPYLHHVRLPRHEHGEEDHQGPAQSGGRHQVWHPSDSTRLHDVCEAAHEELQHDAQVAAAGSLQLRVPDVP